MKNRSLGPAVALVIAMVAGLPAAAQQSPSDILSEGKWQEIDRSVDRALRWLASEQNRDGSFPTRENGNPAITSLCVLAFAAQGHLPNRGPYGTTLSNAVEFILKSQKPNGLNSVVGPSGPIRVRGAVRRVGTAASYNHAISSLALGELYGMS